MGKALLGFVKDYTKAYYNKRGKVGLPLASMVAYYKQQVSINKGLWRPQSSRQLGVQGTRHGRHQG